VNLAEGRAEVEAAVAMVEEIPGQHRVTLGGDKNYDTKEFVQEMRDHQVTPHLALKATTIIDARTTGHPGYAISQQKRKRVEEIFGWLKTVGGLRKSTQDSPSRCGAGVQPAASGDSVGVGQSIRQIPASDAARTTPRESDCGKSQRTTRKVKTACVGWPFTRWAGGSVYFWFIQSPAVRIGRFLPLRSGSPAIALPVVETHWRPE
jgi:hypothetical protein